jgi:hypothetical protein
MPGLEPGIHVFLSSCNKDVDGRDKPGHDEEWWYQPRGASAFATRMSSQPSALTDN